MQLDWLDVALHAAVAVWVGIAAYSLDQYWMLAGNAFFWFGREWGQHDDKPWTIFTRPQRALEWAVPTVTAPAMVGLLWFARYGWQEVFAT